MHPALDSVSHRPWPLPAGAWIMAQTWHDLLFAHWPVEATHLIALVPAQLPLDSFDGRCWVGVVPFHMSGIHARNLPPIAGLSRFPELNVRTYVTLNGKPGVYFFSLDAASLPAVWAARTFFRLPYFHAQMSVETAQDAKGHFIMYDSRRRGNTAEFRGRYRPSSDVQKSEMGSLEHWLTERYCLYTVDAGRVFRAEVHHQPWPLQQAEADLEVNNVAAASGISLPSSPPLLHFGRKLDVLIWPLQSVI
jgi:uncharacterized protein YqjF (DUF2071 family)